MVIRIMVMVPIYAIASFISLISLQAAFFIDAVRDIYEVSVFMKYRLYRITDIFRHLSSTVFSYS